MEYSSLVFCGLCASFAPSGSSAKLDEREDESEGSVEPAKAFSFSRRRDKQHQRREIQRSRMRNGFDWRDSSHLASPASRGITGSDTRASIRLLTCLPQDSDDAGHPRATRGLAVPETGYQRAISVAGNRA